MSRAEDICEQSLKMILKDQEPVLRNLRPDWLKYPFTGRNLELDFYMPKSRIAIEIQGQHHFEDIEQKKRDAWKKNKVEEVGIYLFRVTPTQISPFFFYRKFLKLSLKDEAHKAVLKKFDMAWKDFVVSVVSPYSRMLKAHYGIKQECFVDQDTHERLELKRLSRKKLEDYLKYTTVINIDIRGRKVPCVFEELSETKVRLRVLGTDHQIYVKCKKLSSAISGEGKPFIGDDNWHSTKQDVHRGLSGEHFHPR